MRKFFFFGIILLTSLQSFSQSDTSAAVEQYCEVIATPRLLSTKVTIDIDFGERRSIWKDNRLKEDDGKLKKFNTVIDALNYMGKDGWKLVNGFPVYTSANTQVYHYVFKKIFLKSDTLE